MGTEPEKGSHEELRVLLDRPRGLKVLFQRYLMGNPTEKLLTKEQLAERLAWDKNDVSTNDRRIRIIRDELVFTMEGLREQFAKVGAIIALFALMIAFSLGGTAQKKTVQVICVAAMVGLWVQSPRLKVFAFPRRPDSGLRVGDIKDQLDEYYYLYVWLTRREQTLHAAEVLVMLVSSVGILALGYVAFVV